MTHYFRSGAKMTRISKQEEKRAKNPKKHRNPSLKTGSKKDNLKLGYKEQFNVLAANSTGISFIPKIK
jgi:hypothetical protein